MANFSKIILTFTSEIMPLGAYVGFRMITTPPVSMNYIGATGVFYTTNGNPNFFLIPQTSTVNVGERLAISYKETLDIINTTIFSGLFQITRTINVIEIIVQNSDTVAYEFLTDSICDPTISVVINNSYTIGMTPDEIIDPINFDTFSIEIIDTYVNSLPTIIEKTQLGSPKLEYDGGDDLFKSIITSKLSFNILNEYGADGKFFHLFTGDEQRYLVKLFNKSTDGFQRIKTLIWQGYLLPDSYKEPWHNGCLFIDFVAVDMLATLKGKYLQPWHYANRFPIGKLLACCLSFTGLNQDIIVAPSLIHELASFDKLNFPLQHYVSKEKYTDVYTILKDVLESMGMSIYSYRNTWYIIGVTRKRESSNNLCVKFNSEGDYVGLSTINKKVDYQMMADGSVNIEAITPFKKVNVNFDLKGKVNLFSEDATMCHDLNTTRRYEDSGKFFIIQLPLSPSSVYLDIYRTKYFKNWSKTGNALQQIIPELTNELWYRSYSLVYSVSEAEALNNYFSCNERPGVIADFEYLIEIDLNIDSNDIMSIEKLSHRFPFQILVDGFVIYTHSPNNSKLESFKQSGDSVVIKTSFKSPMTGNLEFRILAFIGVSYLDPDLNLYIRANNSFKLTSVLEKKEIESINASRAINFTNEFDIDLKYTCICNDIIENSIGIGAPTDLNFIKSLDKNNNRYLFTDNHYLNVDGVVQPFEIIIDSFAITETDFNILSTSGNNKLIYKENSMGSESFSSAYFLKHNGSYRIGFLKSRDIRVLVPEDYFVNDILSTDNLKYFYINYGPELKKNREHWKIDSVANVDRYVNQLAKMYHYVMPETLFSLEAEVLGLVFPDELIKFFYDDDDRNFIPTKLSLNLTTGKTSVKATEAKFQVVTDITIK
jgi:hypothetical protein